VFRCKDDFVISCGVAAVITNLSRGTARNISILQSLIFIFVDIAIVPMNILLSPNRTALLRLPFLFMTRICSRASHLSFCRRLRTVLGYTYGRVPIYFPHRYRCTYNIRSHNTYTLQSMVSPPNRRRYQLSGCVPASERD
jgi:hypothetical protein